MKAPINIQRVLGKAKAREIVHGELPNLMLTPSNVDDRKPVRQMARQLFGKLFGDNGYLSKKLFEELLCTFNVQLVVGIRSNAKNVLMPGDGQAPVAQMCHLRNHH